MDTPLPSDPDSTVSRAILRALPAHVALLDRDGRIVDVNDGWVRFAAENGLGAGPAAMGGNYLEVCDRSAAAGCEEAARAAAGLRQVLRGVAEEFTLEYACHSPTQRRWFRLSVRRADGPAAPRAVVMHVDITERRTNEDALREQSALLRHAQRIAELGYWFLDLPADVLVLSEEARRILALAEGEVLRTARGLFDYVHPEDRGLVQRHIAQLARIDSTADFQARIRRSDGAQRWLRVRAESAMREDGRRIYGTLMDITEGRAAGEAIKASEARARRLAAQFARTLDMSLDVICAIGEDGRFQQVSAACERLWGYKPEDLIGRVANDLLIDEDRTRSEEAGLEVRAGRPLLSFKNRLRRADGSVAHVSWSAHWSPDDRTMYCVARDESTTLLLEEAHRQRELLLQTTLDSVTEALIIFDAELRFTYLNKEAQRLLRCARDDLLGRRLEEAFPDGGTAEIMHMYRRALAEQKAGELEFLYEPYGIWVGLRFFPSPDRLTVHFRDITEERRIRQALLESEARFKVVARVTADAVWDWNIVEDTLWWTEGVHSLFGVESHETHPGARGWEVRLHPEERDHVIEDLRRVIASDDDTWTAHYRFRRSDGSYAIVHDRAYVMRDERGRAVRMVGGMSDVTTQRAIEDQLREQAQLLDAARDAIHVLDMEQRVRYWNRSAETLYGWSAGEVQGAPVQPILRPDATAFEAASLHVHEKGEWSGELERTTRDGRRLLVDSRWTLMRGGLGQPSRILVIDTDITERKELESRAMRAQRLDSIGTLAGGIAHDLNNVFTPILMSANLLSTSHAPGSTDATLVQAIAGSAQRGADMVAHLLSFARGAEGRPTALDPAQVLTEVHRIASDTFPKNIRVELECPAALWTVDADATQLHQVLLNLAVNARDAMPDGGRLSLRASNVALDAAAAAAIPEAGEGTYVAFEVTDTGTGMTREVMEKIFDPFFTTKERGRGTGLGLPTSRAIVKGHRGFIQVSSELGRGSRFRVLIPARSGAGMPAGVDGEEDDARIPRGQGERVLVVDDEAEIRRIVCAVLEARGYRVLQAVDGADAIATFARERADIHVVLMDMMMPVMDGAAACQVLRRMDPELPIIASSGFSTGAQVSKAREAGVELVLAKPFTQRRLLECVARAVASRKAAPGTPTSPAAA